MPSTALYAPWRMEYLRSLDKPTDKGGGCFLCDCAAATTPEQRRNLLVLWDTPQSMVIINRYPYSNGHLLIAPKAHKAELEDLTDAEHLDIQKQNIEAIRLLRRAVSAQGFNLGTNLGRIAGAGVPGHLHQHIVPRWSGDTNFITIVGEVRVVPQAMTQLYDELLKIRAEMANMP